MLATRAIRRLLVPIACACACGGPPAPSGPGIEPTDTTEQTRKASPAPATARPRGRAPSAPQHGAEQSGNGSELPPTYDLALIPKCSASAQGSKTGSPLKSFVGVTQPDLINAYGPPSCMYRGRWRYEFRAEPCPSYVDTLELKLSGGTVRSQSSYRRSTGITCSPKKPPK